MTSSDRNAGLATAIQATMCVMFVASTWMAPLYYQNQNTKFLHGLATAFPERLGADWTAGTVDGLPVFTGLVHAVAAWSSPVVFYGLEIALLAVMFLSLLALARVTAPQHGASPLFLAIVAGVLVLLVHPPQEDSLRGVAGQNMMRGYLQPSEFGILYLPALLLALRRHPAALVLAAVPAAIHPAYIAFSAIAVAIIAWDRWRAGLGLPLLPLSGALALLVLPPLDLAIRFAPTDPDVMAKANAILAFERIPFHSDPREWADFVAFRKLALALLGLAVAPAGILRNLLAALLVLAVGGAGFVALTGNAEIALMAPWRASILIVPLSTVLLLGWLLERLFDRFPSGKVPAVLTAVALAAAGWAALEGAVIKLRQVSGSLQSDHVAFARATYTPGTLYLTDPALEDFRLDAMVPQFVSRKTHPYFDTEVLEWDHRLRLAEDVFSNDEALDCAALERVLALYPVTHVLVENNELPSPPCSALTPVFEGETHVVLAVDAGR
ncbi:DUF6798 domain-containing protein [Aliiruegeria sabulilitoris]|uniref:DUF6798 domain-containing protein n=1 Tax=Aliiruegeria sabulilitoris TaxID=1510458 RepID=UPI000836CDC2|nr:DUF6798 domain-containing protein [Aliiruegeria sabulilitoris]NDR57752.1 hypothetical protein [Pseudoruegeria sp. M32A2M]